MSKTIKEIADELELSQTNVGLNHLAFNCTNKESFYNIQEKLVREDYHILYNNYSSKKGKPDNLTIYFEDLNRIKIEIDATFE